MEQIIRDWRDVGTHSDLPRWAAEYGHAELRQDGETVTVVRADLRIGVTIDLWQELTEPHIRADGTLQLDTAGEYVYEHVAFDATGNVMIFQRVGWLTAADERDRLARQLASIIEHCDRSMFGLVRTSAIYRLVCSDPADEEQR